MILIFIVGLCFWFLQNHHYYTLFFGLFCIAVVLAELYFTTKKYYDSIDRVLLAMLYDDFSLKTEKKQSNETLNNLQQLYKKLQLEKQTHQSKEQVYLNIFNNIETAIVILEKSDQQWDIFLINNYFSNYFNIPQVRSWQSLHNLVPNLCTHIENSNFSESKSSVEIQIEDGEKQTFMLQTSKTLTLHKEYYVILLDSIQRVLDKKEKDSWINLMKIISHELMNSLTPIHSLAYNIQEILEQDQRTQEDEEDIALGLKTIVNRSNHLQYFVDNYRKLTMLPTPNKTISTVGRCVENCVSAMRPLLDKHQVNLEIEIEGDPQIYLDVNQLEQVLINLLTNAMHAVSESDKKEIDLVVKTRENRLTIEVIDSGLGIAEEIKQKIFIPFYTTRKEGAGIGLPLSKSIIEMHGGYLHYHRVNHKTVFAIHLPIDLEEN